MDKIKVIIKRPDEKVGHMTHISNTLENLQKTVGGNIESVTLPRGCVLICNETGKIDNLPHNFRMGVTLPDVIRGTVIIAGVDGDDFGDVPVDLDAWRVMLRCWLNEV